MLHPPGARFEGPGTLTGRAGPGGGRLRGLVLLLALTSLLSCSKEEPPPQVVVKPAADADAPIAPEISGYALVLRQSRNMYYGRLLTEDYRKAVESLMPAGPSMELARAYYQLGKDLLRWNETEEAIEDLEKAVEILRASGRKDLEADALYQLGVAQLRQGMLENCLPMRCGEA